MHDFVYMICKYFPYFKLKIHYCIYKIYYISRFLALLTSEYQVICTVMLRHLSQFRRLMVRYNVPKDFFPRL